MTFDELKDAWQCQDRDAKVSVDAAGLTRLIRREQRNWSYLILRRDILEVAAAFLGVGFSLYFAVTLNLVPMYLVAGGALFVGVFFVADRALQRTCQPREDQPMVDFIKRSIDQSNHQIWLLRNIFWWYLLPPGIGMAVVLSYVLYLVLQDGLLSRAHVWEVLYLTGVAVLVALTFWGVYLLNQRAVRNELLPRKQELEELLETYALTDQDDAV